MVLYAKDIIEPDFISTSTETSALEAARSMKERRHGFVVVVGQLGDAIGIVTEWDYLSKIVAEDKNPREVKLRDVMSTNLVAVRGDEGIDNVSRLMAEKGIRRVLVVENGKLLGVITAKTILMRMDDYINKISSQIARMQSPF
jgi:CBS domain-containing protein